ncbi:MAG: hypothetical protein AAGA37_22345 [Actinomycetota bacterium]
MAVLDIKLINPDRTIVVPQKGDTLTIRYRSKTYTYHFNPETALWIAQGIGVPAGFPGQSNLVVLQDAKGSTWKFYTHRPMSITDHPYRAEGRTPVIRFPTVFDPTGKAGSGTTVEGDFTERVNEFPTVGVGGPVEVVMNEPIETGGTFEETFDDDASPFGGSTGGGPGPDGYDGL